MIRQIVSSQRGIYVLTDDGRLFERVHDPRNFGRDQNVFIYRWIKDVPGSVQSIASSPASLFVVIEGELFEQVRNTENPLVTAFHWRKVEPPPAPPSPESMV